MFTIATKWEGQPLSTLGTRMEAAVALKVTELTHLAFDKVYANLTGKILQKQTGELAGSLRETVDVSSGQMTGTVFISPETRKAWVLEKGGQAYYEIVPSKASILAFIGKGGEKVFAKAVNHPPSRPFHYIEEAWEEMRPLVPQEIHDAVQEAIGTL